MHFVYTLFRSFNPYGTIDFQNVCFQIWQDGKPVQLEYWEGWHRSESQAILYSMVVLGKSELRSETLWWNFPINQANNNSEVIRFKELVLNYLIHQFTLYSTNIYYILFTKQKLLVRFKNMGKNWHGSSLHKIV